MGFCDIIQACNQKKSNGISLPEGRLWEEIESLN